MLTLDLHSLGSSAVGAEHGVEEAAFRKALAGVGDLPTRVGDALKAGQHLYLSVPKDASLLSEVRETLAARKFRDLVVIGIGGSSLGSRMLADGLATVEAKARLRVLENVDPGPTAEALRAIDYKNSLFHIVTKSGGTAEALALAMLALERLRKAAGKNWQKQVVVTTGENELKEWALAQGLAVLPVPAAVGGRYSVLTPVGLVTSEFLGLDTQALLKGAADCADTLLTAPAERNAALQFSVAQHLLDTRHGKTQLVIMPYADRLAGFSAWLKQLWAESLGKVDANGKGVGQTPLFAAGATDQHSQLQLYIEGPRNKSILFLRVEGGEDLPLPAGELEGLGGADFLRGKTLRQLFDAEQAGTAQSLREAGRPHCTMTLNPLDARSLGAMITFFELATTFSGALYGINPYDQPGVEAGKKATLGLLSGAFDAQKDGSRELRVL